MSAFIRDLPWSAWCVVIGALITIIGALFSAHESREADRKTKTFQTKVIKKQDKAQAGIDEILATMKRVERNRASEFEKEFPYGHTLFGITGTKEIVPFSGKRNDKIQVNWTNASVAIFMDGRAIVTLPELVTPNFQVKNVRVHMAGLKKSADYLFPIDISSTPGMKVDIDRADLFGGGIAMDVGNPNAAIVVRLLEAETGSIFVLGLRPYTRPPEPEMTAEEKRQEREMLDQLYGPRWNPRTGQIDPARYPKGKEPPSK